LLSLCEAEVSQVFLACGIDAEKYFSSIPYLFCISSNTASRYSLLHAGGQRNRPLAAGRAAASTYSFEVAATTE
jgi:hypothetical protein